MPVNPIGAQQQAISVMKIDGLYFNLDIGRRPKRAVNRVRLIKRFGLGSGYDSGSQQIALVGVVYRFTECPAVLNRVDPAVADVSDYRSAVLDEEQGRCRRHGSVRGFGVGHLEDIPVRELNSAAYQVYWRGEG